jgi:hypothetical protein
MGRVFMPRPSRSISGNSGEDFAMHRLDCVSKKPGRILPSRELRRCRTSVDGEPPSFGTIADQTSQRLRQRGDIVGRH